jgi:hypothetical protein
MLESARRFAAAPDGEDYEAVRESGRRLRVRCSAGVLIGPEAIVALVVCFLKTG